MIDFTYLHTLRKKVIRDEFYTLSKLTASTVYNSQDMEAT